MNSVFNYQVEFPEDVKTILEQDFFVLDHVSAGMLKSVSEPIKFAANTWVFINKGLCKCEINLISHEIEAPALVSISSSQIMSSNYISDDFEATVIVMSKRFYDNLFIFLANSPIYTLISRHPVVQLSEEMLPKVSTFVSSLHEILTETENPYGAHALTFEVATFIYRHLWRSYEPFKQEIVTNQGRMSDQFLALAQANYKKERFLDFYAQKLEVTPKHLSRTIKSQTGYTAVEWIERFVILEAKVLLKSSNMNIQQIADELNFPSQSFFGKYFKKYTGMSPKEFRNS